MAKIKFSALVSEMSGKLNGSVIARGKNYTTLRNRVIPVNVNTASQSAVRQIFASISKNWSLLTEEQRIAWNNAVSQWKGTGIFADELQLTGKALYQKLNNNLLMNGFPGINLPPTKSLFPAVSMELTYTFAGGQIQVGGTVRTIDNQNFGIENIVAIWKFSKPLSAGTSNVSNKLVKIGQTEIPVDNNNIAEIFNDEYDAKFGARNFGTIGAEVFLLNTLTGETSKSVKETKTLIQ